MSTRPIIDKYMAQQMVKMFDELYRQGICDCLVTDDEGRCREFLENTNAPGVFGLLTDDFYIGAYEWQLRLQLFAGRFALRNPMCRMFGVMGNYLTNYLGCFLPLASDFYRKGIKDALRYGHKVDLGSLSDKKKVWLGEKGFRKVDNDDYKDLIQQMCYDRMRLEQTFKENDELCSRHELIQGTSIRKLKRYPRQWEHFVVSMSLLTTFKL